jgi:hypothetical protein
VYRLLTVAGAVLLLVGAVAGVVNREVLDAGRFSGHVDAVRADPDVSRQLGVLVTDRILEAQPDLTAIRPLLESTAASVVASPALGSTVRAAAVGPLYKVLTRGGHDTVVLRLADVAAIVIGVVNVASPQHRAALPAEIDVRLSEFGAQDTAGEPLSWVHLVRWLSWFLPLIGLLVLATAGAFVPDGRGRGRARRDRVYGAVAGVGRGALGAGVALAFVLVAVGFVVGRLDDTTLSGALTHAAWGELDGDFWAAAGVLAAAGYLLLLLGNPVRARVARDLGPRGLVAHVWRQLVDPGPRLGPRAARAVFILLAGVALVLQPVQLLRALLWAAGLLLVVLATALLVPILVEASRRAWRRSAPELHEAGERWGVIVLALAGVVLLLPLLVWAWPAEESASAGSAGAVSTCNGYAVLCDRAYDEVAYPATHNAMAAADQPGWFFAEQPDGILSQLDHGIRVLLVDSWYGQRTQRPGIVANTDQSRAAALAEARQSFGAAALQSALRLRDALDLTPRGPVEPYLCHALCELGSTKWLPVMDQVRAWLEAHPDEVVTLFVQDTVSPADTARVFDQAGLLPYVYTPASDGQQWPTLRQMIESGQRLVVMMEEQSGGDRYPWLLPGFRLVQDTPYLFRRPSQFSCAPNRGPADASLFLLNHWITNKRREVTNATRVNARDVLLPRAEQCEEERGLLPNFVAVDFYDRGDLFGVVDTLNGIG